MDDPLLAQMIAELTRLEEPLTFVLRPSSAFHLVAVMQLAQRHPQLPDEARRIAATFVEHVREYFRDQSAPACLEAIRRGNDRTFDQGE